MKKIYEQPEVEITEVVDVLKTSDTMNLTDIKNADNTTGD